MSENRCLDKNRHGMVQPVVDFSRCEGKDACVKVCPYDVLDDLTDGFRFFERLASLEEKAD